MPSSCRPRRATASPMSSPGPGCPQKEFVQTPGQVRLPSARRVTRMRPASSRTWQEKARCSGVSVVCTSALGAVPMGRPSSSSRTTSSSPCCMFTAVCHTDRVDASSGSPPAIADGLHAVDAVLERFFSVAGSRASAIGAAYEELWSALRQSAAGGKRLRPRLVLQTYGAFGGRDLEAAAHVGAAFELLHTALIVHDDVIDRDYMRRGPPNVSGRYRDEATTAGIPIPAAEHRGMSTAIIAGPLALTGGSRVMDYDGIPPAV